MHVDEMVLYSYFRSSCSYRVRIALNIKKLSYRYVPVHLLNEGGEQNQSDFRQLNPKGEVPLLTHNGFHLSQSMAILQYIEGLQPDPLLFPSDPKTRAKVFQFCEIINSGIQPLQNLRVANKLRNSLKATDQQIQEWVLNWIEKGFVALEEILKETAQTYCFGSSLTAADVFLVPQVYSAHRFNIDLSPFPRIEKVSDSASKLAAFKSAHPDRQIDAPKA